MGIKPSNNFVLTKPSLPEIWRPIGPDKVSGPSVLPSEIEKEKFNGDHTDGLYHFCVQILFQGILLVISIAILDNENQLFLNSTKF